VSFQEILPPPSLRHQHRHHSSPAVTVDVEMLVQRKNTVADVAFQHRHEARVGKGHGKVAVFFHQREDSLRLVMKAKWDLNKATPDPFPYLANGSGHALQEKTSLRQDRLAGQKRRADVL